MKEKKKKAVSKQVFGTVKELNYYESPLNRHCKSVTPTNTGLSSALTVLQKLWALSSAQISEGRSLQGQSSVLISLSIINISYPIVYIS